MGLASIPRSVGHNFVPEYQISAVPYVVNLSSASSKFIIFSKNANKGVPDNTPVGEASTATGTVTMTNTDVALTDVFTDTSGNGIIEEGERKADNLIGADFEAIEMKVIELPKISQWIQFIPTIGDANGIEVGFSRADIHLSNTINFLDNSRPTPQGADADSVQSMFYPMPFKIRCTNLYFTTTGIKGKLLVGLTSIDRSEFTEVVETFLGD